MTVRWTVELPEENKYNGQACDDPAVEAAMCTVRDHCSIYLWGEQEDPADITLEVCEEDVEIEEDDR